MKLTDPRLPLGADVPRLVAALYDVLRRITNAVNSLADSRVLRGQGSPEGVVTATLGRLYMDTTGGRLYVKQSGDNTDTGWVQK